ncbi:MAG: serine protein kinase PrkA [Proteobacteria bacterium]|nr:serine protein kinase PrkA [Pseudomonadota bacterium]
MSTTSTREYLTRLGDTIQKNFTLNRRVMSFAEYLELVRAAPRSQMRSAPQYVHDCFLHYGVEDVEYPWDTVRRFRLFDCPWADGRDRLIGQEEVQNRVFRALSNFVREGTSNKLILLHGPNGSAKSTLVRCIGRALQHYSTLDEGALYRINWIFPAEKIVHAGIGFARSDDQDSRENDTYAYLPEELIDVKLADDLRDHPLLLIPPDSRRQIMQRLLAQDGVDSEFILSDYLRFGQLSHKNRTIYEALLSSYQGEYLKVLRHVQVERFYVQHRYREGYVTVEPQLSVDASERQITADRSLAALPSALQSTSLYEYGGEVIGGNRGLIEYSDLLKRPLEAYKYLLTTVERASVNLPNATLYLDLVFVGTSNEIHLSAFKETAEFQSFKGRLDLVRVPYLLDFEQEQAIYAQKIEEAAGARKVAPHCAYVAALWAVLTRMRKPQAEAFPEELRELIVELTPLAKAELYATGRAPETLSPAQAKLLRSHLSKLWHEADTYPNYEGLTGASPREMLVVVFNAAHSTKYSYVSPLAILDELEALARQVSVYGFLKQEIKPGGFHDHRNFIEQVRGRLLDRTDDEVRSAMGLVEESEYERVFQRYVNHVMHWTKKEKVLNPTTGRAEDPDENLMREVEKNLEVTESASDFRHDLIAKIGAWSLDHLNEKPDYLDIFADYFKRLKESYFDKRKKSIRRGIEELLTVLAKDGASLAEDARKRAQHTLDNLVDRFGYHKDSVRDAVSLLFRERYAD